MNECDYVTAGKLPRYARQEARISGEPADVGLVLMDLSMRPIAIDQGAAAILNYQSRTAGSAPPANWIPKELLNSIRGRSPAELSSINTRCRIGATDYFCRSYIMESPDGFLGQPIMALHLAKDLSTTDTIDDVAARYHLTRREQEVLLGISSGGLTNKELAVRMNISPNTVKLFLRLAMIKMGVTTRAGLVAKILNDRNNGNGAAAGAPVV